MLTYEHYELPAILAFAFGYLGHLLLVRQSTLKIP